jgi:hypothetical protein
VRRFDSLPTALAGALAGAVWLHQALSVANPTLREAADRTIFLFAGAYAALELGAAVVVRVRRRRSRGVRSVAPAGDLRVTRLVVAGSLALAALILFQTLSHLGRRSPYLYVTYPAFPTGVSTSADGYVVWLDDYPAYAESWQFAKLANLLSGAAEDRDTGDTDARGVYSYMAALLARPLGFVPAFITLNALFWLAACLAVWYLGRVLLGSSELGLLAALLTACGQGFVFMASTPMSYVVGYAWWGLVLALAARWCLFGWAADGRRWLAWGVVCGVGGLVYFTHVVTLGAAWVFGGRRAPLGGMAAATTLALLVPAAWFLVGSGVIGLGFRETTANDLAGQARGLARLAVESPLLLPSAAGSGSLRALVGGFGPLVLALAAVGAALAAPRRRQWYVAVGVCGLVPVFILHMIPVTQRYGYLAYPAIYLAATEGLAWLARLASDGVRERRRLVMAVGAGVLVAAQLYQANADLLGDYRFALAFGAP